MIGPSRALAAALLAAAFAGCASVDAVRLERSGTAALDRGDALHAVADLERAAALAPAVSGIQNHLGIAYEQAGRRDDALHAYEHAVELDCGNAAAAANLEALHASEARNEPKANEAHRAGESVR